MILLVLNDVILRGKPWLYKKGRNLTQLFTLYSPLKQALLKRRHMLHVYLGNRDSRSVAVAAFDSLWKGMVCI